MKFFRFSLLFLAISAFTAALIAEPVLKTGDRLAIIGDSITEQKQYSRFIEDYLTVCQPQLNVRVVQFGWGGETANGFSKRMGNDLLPFKPTVATTCYGMNDGGYRAYDEGVGKNYDTWMRDIVKRLAAVNCTVVVGGPGAVDSKTFKRGTPPEVYNESLGKLGDIAKKIAEEYKFPSADVHGALMDTMAKSKAVLGENYDVCGGDGVHPNANGQLIMAYAFLKAMGLDGNIGTITVDMKDSKTTTDNAQKVINAKDGVIEIESTRYPFCFFGDLKSSNSTRSILPYTTFNEELNRMTLVVKNLGGESANITWGKDTKVFTRTDLEKGINLAAEFTDNPFTVAFMKIDGAVATKQNFETFMIKNQINAYPGLLANMPNDEDVKTVIATLTKKLWDKNDSQAKDVKTLITPIKHTITIAVLK